MIIVCGPDGSGKTTLIQHLGYERRHLRALRAGRGADGDKKQGWGAGDEAPIAYARHLLNAQADEEESNYYRHVAFDRFHVSEQVYGPLLRGASGISDEEATVLRRLIHALGIPVVTCLPPLDVILTNVFREGRERPAYQTESFLRRTYAAFADRAQRDDHLVYDFTRHPVPLLGDQPKIPRAPEVVGGPFARYLIVGEKSTLPLDLPFFSMHGSSGYLNRALWYAGFREEELAFTNAQTSDGRPRDLRACLLAITQHVIALGVDATRACVESGLAPVYTVPHPQYWKRFHAANPEGYTNRLKEIREATR